MKLVSVVVPFYNAQKFIWECINSVLIQTYQNIELILVNDGSTDNSFEIITGINDNRLVIISQENQGVSTARNSGIEASKGDYLCFVDADDLLEADFIKNMVYEIETHHCDIVFGNYKLLYENGNRISKTPRINEGSYISSDLFNRCIDDGTLTGMLFGSVCGTLYKSSLIKDHNIYFRKNIKVNEDGIFNIELMKNANTIWVSSNSDYLYRQWKNTRKESLSFETNELDKATDVLRELSFSIPNGNTQIARRNMSVFFWATLRVENTSMSCFQLSKRLKEYRNSNTIFDDNYDSLDFKNLNRYKKILIKLLKYNMYFTYVFILKHIAPGIQKRVRH